MALPAAEAAVGAHELLERRDLVRLGVVHAVDEDVGAVGEAVGAPQVVGCVGAEVAQRVLAGDLVVVRGAALPRPPSTIAPSSSVRTITNPMPGCSASVPISARMQRLDLLGA